jgi:hypothetical protein
VSERVGESVSEGAGEGEGAATVVVQRLFLDIERGLVAPYYYYYHHYYFDPDPADLLT